MTPQDPTIELVELADGTLTHVRWWRPARPRGAVLYFHGIQSHGGWYEESGRRLAAAGFAVLMPDRRGSGLNAPPKGHFSSLDQCLEDNLHLLNVLKSDVGATDAHLLGVSWGGKQAVQLAQDAPESVKTVTLVGPGLFPRIDLTMMEKFRVGISMMNDRERLHDIPLNDAAYFTENPERIDFVNRDSLKLLQVSAAFLLTSRRLDKHIRTFHQAAFRSPMHLMLAGRDRIIDNERTKAWFRSLPSPDRRVTEYPEGGHTLEFERHADPFFEDMVNWIVERA
ncbi:MAG: alpha/beta fold hydrolase [Phycisphaerae bacterium]|nr:alpha/beta fold hydrolase [Phycisphaerae bacterium]